MQQSQKINGVNVDSLVETVEAIKSAQDLAKFQFRARNRWIDGGHNRTTVKDFYGAGTEDTSREAAFEFDKDEPDVLLGEDQGANPVEYVLAALAGCLTTSLVYHAAAQGIRIDEVESRYEGDLDLRAFLGLDESIRNGYENLRVTFKIKGDASREKLEELVQMAQARSPVFDIVSHPVPVTVQVED